jgi:hypothetical protein
VVSEIETFLKGYRNNVNPLERYEIDILDLAMISARIRGRNDLIFGKVRSTVAPFLNNSHDISSLNITGTSSPTSERNSLMLPPTKVNR